MNQVWALIARFVGKYNKYLDLNISFLWFVYLYVLNILISVKKIGTHPKAELKQALVLCEISCVTLERFDLWISRSELRDGWSDTFQMCSRTHVACSWESWGCDEFVLWVHKCHPFAQTLVGIWGLSYNAISSINLYIYIWHGVEIMYASKVSVVVEGQAASNTDNSTCDFCYAKTSQGHWCILVSTPIYVFWFTKDG